MTPAAMDDRAEPDADRLTGIGQLSYRFLIEHAADGVLVVDLSGAVLYANPAAADLFGQSLEDLLHVPLGRPVTSGEFTEITVHRPGRAPAEVEMRVVEIAWEGQPALLASLRDVSARRVQEERQRQSQKLEAIGRLAAGIVHDFNNLLMVIESGLRLVRRRLPEEVLEPDVSSMIEEILQRTRNAGALTHQLLAFARQQPLAPEIVDLNAHLRSLTHLLQQTLGRGVRLEQDLDPGVGPVLVDADQLDIAILNLAVNAKDAMMGKGVLTLETRHASDEVSDEEAAFVRITLSDTGCGMSKEVLAQVFEPFFTTKPEGKGTGLGLSQVYGFVRQSGGHVRIDSEIGQGTRIHLYLPVGD